MEIIGIGTDIVQNHRLNKDDKFTKKFLSKKEYQVYLALPHDLKNEFVCGRWAAKEAIIKATSKKYMYNQISIINNKDGKPIVFLDDLKKDNINLSISHEKKYTIAFAIVVK